jgi:septal ring factor EnvC (AmiA/AmiB activator)
MNVIDQQVRRAQVRLNTQSFLRTLTNCLVPALSLAVVALILPKLWSLPIHFATWGFAWIAGTSAIAVLASVIWTWRTRSTRLNAAVEIDRRYEIKERVSSAIQLNDEERSTPVGQALMSDSNNRAEKIDVRDKFGWGLSGRLFYSAIPAALLCLIFFIPDAEPQEMANASQQNQLQLNQVKNSTKSLLNKIQKKNKELEKQEGLEESQQFFKKIEQELKKMSSDGKGDAKKALTDLNKIKKKIADRMAKAGSANELKKSLEGMQGMNSGPSEKMMKAMQEGEFERASEEVEKMLADMREGRLNDEQKKNLADQMEALTKALEQAAAEQEMAERQLQDQIQQAQAAGDPQKAAQLQKKLEELQAASAQLKDLDSLMQKASELKDALESGDPQAAEKAMEEMANAMKQMQGQSDQLKELSEMMDELNQSKDQMTCPNCNGEGCEQCQGGQGSNKKKSGQGNGTGDGSGEGQGQGDRSIEEDDIDFFDSQVRDKMRAGETVLAGKVDGKNRKGVTREEVKSAILTAEAEDSDSLESIMLPKEQRDQAEEYFNSMRDN